MFHAVAMPVSGLSDTHKEVKTHTMDHMTFHCDNLAQDDLKVQSCCSGAALQTVSFLQLMINESNKKHASLAPRLIRHIPDVLFKPPKFYPVLAG